MQRIRHAWPSIAMLTAICSMSLLVLSGCKPPPPKPGTGNTTTDASVPVISTDAPEIDLGTSDEAEAPPQPEPMPEEQPAEEPTEEPTAPVEEPMPPAEEPAPEPAAENAPAEEPMPPAEEPAEEPAPEETPAEEPAPEETPAEEPAPAAEEPKSESAEEPMPSADEPSQEPAAEEAPTKEPAAESASADPTLSDTVAKIDQANRNIKPGSWPMWGGTTYRNNTPETNAEIPTAWDIGDFDRKSGEWLSEDAVNINWVAALGSQSYGNPVVADGKVFVGTNNGSGWLKRYPFDVDLGCLIAFDQTDGSFLWQHSSEKLSTGRVHDWPLQGICCAPYVEGKRAWFVSSRGLVVCVDTEGFHDGEDDGPVTGVWARQFDLREPIEEDAEDQLAIGMQSVEEGKVGEAIRKALADVDIELPEGEIPIEAKEGGKGWKFTAEVAGNQREFHLRREGPALSGYMVTTAADKREADVIWEFDMMTQMGTSQHNMCACSVLAWGDILFVNTSNGLDASHINLPAPNAPSFMALDKNSGEVLWTDKSPGENILHGQWSSPTAGVLAGVPQVIFGGGDGWVYSFRADAGTDGKPELLWKFDANPKTSEWVLGGRGTRNNIIATPVIHDGLVYVAVGQDPEHGEGVGHLWCIDPSKRGDVSPELAVNVNDRETPIEHKRIQAVIEEEGEVAVPNPNSAVVWHYSEVDRNGDDEIDFEETMHRSCGTVAIKNGLLYIADFSGLFHCLDAKTGEPHWTYDMLAAAWGSPLIVNGHVYIGDEDGDVSVFKLSAEENEPIEEINMGNSVYSTPIVANGTLFISNRTHLFSIGQSAE